MVTEVLYLILMIMGLVGVVILICVGIEQGYRRRKHYKKIYDQSVGPSIETYHGLTFKNDKLIFNQF